jgi:SPP1 family predicted phage head-tail adaptor
MSLQAGRLRHRVRIERYDYVLDSSGDVIQDPNSGEVLRDWVLVDEVWAAIEPLSTREFIQSQALQSSVTARIVIRHRDDVDAACRLVHVRLNRPDVIYNPAGILADPDSGLEYITMPCSQGVNDG